MGFIGFYWVFTGFERLPIVIEAAFVQSATLLLQMTQLLLQPVVGADLLTLARFQRLEKKSTKQLETTIVEIEK